MPAADPHLVPNLQLWDRWSRPYIERIIRKAKKEHPTVPITVYANGSGGLLERLGSTGADVVGLDWTVDMADARRRLGPDVSVQVSMQCTAHTGRSDYLSLQERCAQKAKEGCPRDSSAAYSGIPIRTEPYT